jgi:hypothetical protein
VYGQADAPPLIRHERRRRRSRRRPKAGMIEECVTRMKALEWTVTCVFIRVTHSSIDDAHRQKLPTVWGLHVFMVQEL